MNMIFCVWRTVIFICIWNTVKAWLVNQANLCGPRYAVSLPLPVKITLNLWPPFPLPCLIGVGPHQKCIFYYVLERMYAVPKLALGKGIQGGLGLFTMERRKQVNPYICICGIHSLLSADPLLS